MGEMKAFYFPGFPDRARPVSLPESVFSELLPLIDNLVELKVTLHCLWRLSQMGAGTAPAQEPGPVHPSGSPTPTPDASPPTPYLRRRDLLADPVLRAGLGEDPAQAIAEGLERAVVRGTLLHVRVRQDGREEDWYFANSSRGRAAVQALQEGRWPAATPAPLQVQVRRPTIFTLYEQTIGLLSPLIADELREAEATYPPAWIEEAFHRAAEANVRQWRYVRAILERWAREGKEDEDEARSEASDSRRFIRGKYGDYIEY